MKKKNVNHLLFLILLIAFTFAINSVGIEKVNAESKCTSSCSGKTQYNNEQACKDVHSSCVVDLTCDKYCSTNSGSSSNSENSGNSTGASGNLCTSSCSGKTQYNNEQACKDVHSSCVVDLTCDKYCGKETTYIVTFNAMGGTLSTQTKTVTNGLTYGTLPTPTKSNAHFDGWYTSQDGTGPIYSTTTVNLTSNQTLYAHWTTANANTCVCGTSGSISTYHTISCTSGTCENACNTNFGQAVIIGSCGSGGSGSGGSGSGGGGTTTTIKITYNCNGGTGTMADQTTTSGTRVTLNENKCTKEGATFIKWNTKADGSGTNYADKASVTPTSNMTLYAQWEDEAENHITFDCNGGNGTMEAMTVELNKEVTLIENKCVRTDYTFVEWNTKADGTGTSYPDKGNITPTEDVTLYAQWNRTSNTYKIHYNANGGTGAMEDTVATIGVEGTLRENKFTYKDHTFTGWKAYVKDSTGNMVALKNSENNDMTFTDKAKFKDLYGDDYAEVTLYAQWKIVNPKTGIFVPTMILLAVLVVSGIGYYFTKKNNKVLN